jgi:uncharacterized membrane protein YphA (DoxX/SURF4 family)
MFVAYTVIAVLLALALPVSATAKLRRVPRAVDGLNSLGVPLGLFPLLAASEIAGAGGLVIGLWYRPLGIAAAIGLVLYFVGAVGAHLRDRDFTGMPNAAVMPAASTAALILGRSPAEPRTPYIVVATCHATPAQHTPPTRRLP